MTFIVDYRLPDSTTGSETFHTRALAAIRVIELEDIGCLFICLSIQIT
jgi:hypothetical protein